MRRPQRKAAFVDMMIETMIAKMPSAEAKISITKIFTNRAAFCASASAQPLPQMPTHTLRDGGGHWLSVRGNADPAGGVLGSGFH